MVPYFETKLGKLFHGDCLTIMPELEQVDLVITSPPYDNLRDYQGYSFDFECVAKKLFKITKECGVVVWVVGDATINGSETGNSFRQALYFKEIGFNLHDTMIYLKDGSPYPSKNRYRQVFEYMFIFSKGFPKTFNPIKRRNKYRNMDKNSYRQKSGEMKLKTIQKFPVGTAFNVWQYIVGYNKSTQDKIAFGHPAIFPQYLVQDHVVSWSNPNDIVLDIFMGSGTTAKMCEINNRRWIGIEISEEYCEIAAKRIEKEISQLKLPGC